MSDVKPPRPRLYAVMDRNGNFRADIEGVPILYSRMPVLKNELQTGEHVIRVRVAPEYDDA